MLFAPGVLVLLAFRAVTLFEADINNSKNFRELLMRIELTTSSLPRKCSTPELQQLAKHPPLQAGLKLSGRRGSNSPPIAWKAIALPNELLPLIELQVCLHAESFELRFTCSLPTAHCCVVGREGFEPSNS